MVLLDQSSVNNSNPFSGSIMVNTINLTKKAGADYIQTSGQYVQTDSENSSSIALVSEAEGPLKLFYNSIVNGLIYKYYVSANASGTQNIQTPVVFHATEWFPGWALNGPTIDDNYGFNDILIKSDKYDEYALHRFFRNQNGDLYREISEKTYQDIFIESFSKHVSSSFGSLFNTGTQSVEYFIEFTNDSIVADGRNCLEQSSGFQNNYALHNLQHRQSGVSKTSDGKNNDNIKTS